MSENSLGIQNHNQNFYNLKLILVIMKSFFVENASKIKINLKRGYFTDKNYSIIYLNLMGHRFSWTLFSFFAGAYLYSMGLALYLVILFMGLQLGLQGILSPLSSVLSSKYGIAKTVLISYIPMILFFVAISFAQQSLLIAFFSFIFFSLSYGIYCPCLHTVQSIYIKTAKRGL